MRMPRPFVMLLSVLAGAAHAGGAEPAGVPASKLFRIQYQIHDPSFCNASACLDIDADGRRELFFASRRTGELRMLNAADGRVRWARKLEGEQQSIAAFDLGDGRFRILYTVSRPGRLYVLDGAGEVLRRWDSGDGKLGNSPVVLDADGDGVPEAYLGTRGRSFVRLDLRDLSVLARRDGWSQCGCHTSALDVDGKGRWALFAGSGDDHRAKGVLHRLDPLTLKSAWSLATDDNASSADPVLADLDGNGRVEVVKSVDNYKGDDAHDAVYALTADGKVLWKVEGLAGEDSPNVADLDGDGRVEIIGMTFACEAYCLDAKGRLKWKKKLRPDLTPAAHAYLTPILCDFDGDRQLEVLVMTNDEYFHDGETRAGKANAVLFALSAEGEILDKLDLGGPRYWGEAFLANVDEDPFQELVVSGSGGVDVIETKGFGPDVEYFQRRRSYRRLNVYPWAYEDTYFIERGTREGVTHLTDNLVLEKEGEGYRRSGRFTTGLLTLPPGFTFTSLKVDARRPEGTGLVVNVLDAAGRVVRKGLTGTHGLDIGRAVKLEFVFSSPGGKATPRLDSYALGFDRRGGGP